MEWKKPFALSAGSFGFFLSFAFYCFGVFWSRNPHGEQNCFHMQQKNWSCADVGSWTCNGFTGYLCPYLEDFKSFGYDTFDAQTATVLIALFYMILNGLLCYGLIKPEVIYRYHLGNAVSTIALMSTLVYVSYLIKLYIILF